MHIAYPPDLLCRLPPQLVSQQAIHAHLRLPLYLPRLPQRNIQHLFRLGNLVNDPVRQRFPPRPLVRLEQHLARRLRPKLEPREVADAREVQAQVDGRHAEEAARRVHDAVVVGEGKGARAAKRVAREEGDGGERKVEERCEELRCVQHG